MSDLLRIYELRVYSSDDETDTQILEDVGIWPERNSNIIVLDCRREMRRWQTFLDGSEYVGFVDLQDGKVSGRTGFML